MGARTLGAICLLLATISFVAVAVADEDPPPGHGVTQITAIEPAAEAAMAVLETSRISTDALPSGLATELDEHARFGMNPDLSRLSIGNLTNSVHVVPADDHVCATLTVADGIDVSCPTTAQIASGESAPTTVALDGEDIAIYGIVPDGVDEVTVETGVSTSTVVETERNAYYTVLESGTVLRTVSYVGPSGAVGFPIYDPSTGSQ